jgi:hypothetical protein
MCAISRTILNAFLASAACLGIKKWVFLAPHIDSSTEKPHAPNPTTNRAKVRSTKRRCQVGSFDIE